MQSTLKSNSESNLAESQMNGATTSSSSLKRINVSLPDISYSKQWNRTVCSSFKKFIASQSDQYVLDHYNFKQPKPCKVLNCSFIGKDCATFMKHIRYEHVKKE